MEPQPVALKKLLLRIGLRILLIVSAILLISLLLPPVLDLFLPFILAFITASILAPIVRKFTKTVGKVRKFWSMLFVILLILVVTGVLGYAVYYLFSQISDLIGSWSSIQVSVTSLLTDLEKFLENNLRLPSPDVEEYALNILQKSVTWLTDKISSWAPSVVVGVGTVASGIANFLISLLFFLVGTYFMTSDYPNLRKKLSTCLLYTSHDLRQPHADCYPELYRSGYPAAHAGMGCLTQCGKGIHCDIFLPGAVSRIVHHDHSSGTESAGKWTPGCTGSAVEIRM